MKNMFRFAAVGAVLASLIAFSASCGGKSDDGAPKKEKKPVIAVIPKGTASMWWEVVHKGANRAGEERGYEILWTGPDQETDREKQIQSVEDCLARQVVGIVLGPNDAKALVRPVEKIKKAGIPCVIIDSAVDADPSMFASFAATDNFAGGAQAAELLGTALEGKGNVILIKFVQNSASTDARAEGFVKTLAEKYPDIKIIDEQYTQGTTEDGRQKAEDMLNRNKGKVNGLFAVNQPVSVGSYMALKSLGLTDEVTMVGFDADPALLDGVSAGHISALIVQNPDEIGYRGVNILVDVLEGKEVEAKVDVPSMVVDAGNLEEMKVKFPAALGL